MRAVVHARRDGRVHRSLADRDAARCRSRQRHVAGRCQGVCGGGGLTGWLAAAGWGSLFTAHASPAQALAYSPSGLVGAARAAFSSPTGGFLTAIGGVVGTMMVGANETVNAAVSLPDAGAGRVVPGVEWCSRRSGGASPAGGGGRRTCGTVTASTCVIDGISALPNATVVIDQLNTIQTNVCTARGPAAGGVPRSRGTDGSGTGGGRQLLAVRPPVCSGRARRGQDGGGGATRSRCACALHMALLATCFLMLLLLTCCFCWLDCLEIAAAAALSSCTNVLCSGKHAPFF